MRFVSPIVIFVSLLVAGCIAPVKTRQGEQLPVGSERFQAHALEVFKRQNNALTALFDVIDQASNEDAVRLEFAEQRLIEECETLNNAAAKRRDGEVLGPRILLNISSTIYPCDLATFKAEELIREIDPNYLPSVQADEPVL